MKAWRALVCATLDVAYALSSGRATLIDGLATAAAIRGELREEVVRLTAGQGVRPGLGVVLVGDRPDSATYVRMKRLAAREIGIGTVDVRLAKTATEADVLRAVARLNGDASVHAILVQLPLPAQIDEANVLRAIRVDKDADGFSAANVGNMCLRGGTAPLALPCTPAGVVELLRRYEVPLAGAHVVVLGRSNIVGMPVSQMLQACDATVTVCHSRTVDVAGFVRQADVLVAAIGLPGFVQADWLKPGCVVVDVGINAVDDATAPRGYRLVGDVADGAKFVASKLTPVPGGVGPVTIAMLLKNTVKLCERQLLDNARRRHERQLLGGPPRAPAKAATRVVDDAEVAAAKRLKVSPARAKVHVERLSPVPQDIDISQACEPRPLAEVAQQCGVLPSELVHWGRHKAKVDHDAVLARLGDSNKRGSLVVVAGINPTPLGEGKSTTTIGLCQALGNELGRKVVTTIRQPSQGPTFGIKGGAAGGGYSQVVPMEEFNLHMTGDIHAIVAANNLVAAALDARMFHEATQKDAALFNRLAPARKDGTRPLVDSQLRRLDRLGISRPAGGDGALIDEADRTRFARCDVDQDSIWWNRVLDTCDRFLRTVEVGRGAAEKGHTRECGFDIAVASEIAAVVALASDMADMRRRLGEMSVARSKAGLHGGAVVTVDDLGCAGALAVLLKDALMPTMMQTLEATPVLVHGGPFANIAHGNSSVIADKTGLALVGQTGFVVTEAGFGADIGFEKFVDIKCRGNGLEPDCCVVVATVRALKMHGGGPPVVPGAKLAAAYTNEDLDLLSAGVANVQKHVRTVTGVFGVPCVVAVNRFAADTDAEIAMVIRACLDAGAAAAVEATHFADGGAGALKLAEAVAEICDARGSKPSTFRRAYADEDSILRKLDAVAKDVYGGDGVELSPLAKEQLAAFEAEPEVYGRLPLCFAKTQYSLSCDASRKGVPTGFTIPVRSFKAALGAGFIVVYAGDVSTMPGLPTRPGFFDIDMADDGRVLGLF
mmetsp:Transcript_31842/g.109525  ORF Transcript_31842/g.109525 Transcript_31842/m.109525 type:complete len:1003 (+) Transcript_31842:39-3047(+)